MAKEVESELNVLADDLYAERQEKADLETALKVCNERIRITNDKMVEMMNVIGRTKFDHNGRLYFLSVSKHPRVLNEEAFFEWLENMGEDGIIKRTVHFQTLKKWYSERPEEQIEALADAGFLEVFDEIRVNIRTGK